MTAQIITWMTVVQGLLAIAPDVVLFAAKVKGWINDLFTSGLITAEAQNALHARVTEICRATLNNETPVHWQIEDDPAPVPVPDVPQAPV